MACGLWLWLGAGLFLVLLLMIACQNGAENSYGAAKPPSVPQELSKKHSPMEAGLPHLPGNPLNPVFVNNFDSVDPPGSKLSQLAQEVMNAAEAATEPLPPRFEPLPELGPQRMWQPTWRGCQSTFVDRACQFFYPNPRLWARDLDELKFRRSLLAGQDNLFEPVGARQGYIQLLSAEARSKKDPYTRASAANDLVQTTCTQMARQVPEYVNF